MNLPNKLTILRVCMIPFFVAALLWDEGDSQTMRVIADVIFIAASLTDIVGERTVTVKAEVRVNGTPCTATQTVSFGAGPLAVFAGKPGRGGLTWDDAARTCGGTPGDADTPGYQPETRLPTKAQLIAVSGRRKGGQYGAAHAAGWPDPAEGTGNDIFAYWTGEASGDGGAWMVSLDDGGSVQALVDINGNAIAVCVTGK